MHIYAYTLKENPMGFLGNAIVQWVITFLMVIVQGSILESTMVQYNIY
jgi:hypothetical protein